MLSFLAAGIAGCKDDDPKEKSNEDVSLISSLEMDYEEQMQTIKVKLDGDWSVKIKYDDEDEEWITLLQESGKDASDIQIIVPTNIDDKHKAEIVISNGNDEQVVTVIQRSLMDYYATIPTNDGDSIDYSKIGNELPLGYAIAMNPKQTLYKKAIFNYMTIKDLAKGKYSSANDIVRFQRSNKYDSEFTLAKNVVKHKDSLKATLSIDVEVALFKFGLKGQFNLANNRNGNTCQVGLYRPSECGTYYFNIDEFKDLYEDVKADGILPTTNFFTKDFNNLYQQIENPNNETKLDSLFKVLDRKYGPIICTSVTIGGSLNVNVDCTVSKDTAAMNIGGKLEAGLTAGIKIKGDVSADYLSSTINDCTKFAIHASGKGGIQDTTRKVVNALADIINFDSSDNKEKNTDIQELTNRFKKVNTLVDNWEKTIDYENKNTYTCLDYNVEGIWTLFSDDISDKIREYMINKYKSTKNCLIDLSMLD